MFKGVRLSPIGVRHICEMGIVKSVTRRRIQHGENNYVNERIARLGKVAALAALLSSIGCQSTVSIAPLPPENYAKLGTTSGSACGFLLLGDWFAAIIPVNLSDRVQTAKF